MDVIEIQNPIKEKPVLVSMETKSSKPLKKIVLTKVRLSDNITNFDKKIIETRKQATPYDYNVVSLGTKLEDYTQPASETITDSTYNLVGKFLGVDTHHEWSKYSDKIQLIVKWAKDKSGAKDMESLVNWISGAANIAPSFGMNHRKIDQLYLYAKLQLNK